ncbi:MAG: hypothetical protein PHD65_09160 [Gallionella sp.]|nr:hypothetical protein [Gallionella sp.]
MNELTQWKQTAIAEQVPPDDNTHLLLQGLPTRSARAGNQAAFAALRQGKAHSD